jgi:nucleoside-triphosphatase
MKGISPPVKHILLLTGPPGIGKTTVIWRVAKDLAGMPIRGFTTRELRAGGQRVGFRLETFDERSMVLAHIDNRSARRVGKYGVDVEAFDRLVESLLGREHAESVFLIDEIGKMECLSRHFVAAMTAVLDSGVCVIATVGLRGEGFIQRVKTRRDADLWHVTRTNRDDLPAQAVAWLKERRATR